MEPLFRISLMRPPMSQDPVSPSIALAQSSDFQTALATASSAPDPRAAVRAVAGAFVASARFVGDPAKTPLAGASAAFSAALDSLAGPVADSAAPAPGGGRRAHTRAHRAPPPPADPPPHVGRG
ncbi:hypothetical protein ACFXCR_19465, partial [Streptomyces sp. NPDC059431]